LLLLAFVAIAVRSLRQLFRASDATDGLRAAALIALLLATAVAGMFDAVLLLALPTLLVFAAAGALYDPPEGRLHVGSRLGRATLGLVALLAALGAARSAA